jgi:putative membrane-bound dehydrogenase-like protein
MQLIMMQMVVGGLLVCLETDLRPASIHRNQEGVNSTVRGRSPAALVVILGAFMVLAEDPLPQVERLQSSPVLHGLKPNPKGHGPKSPADDTLAAMYVRPGFQVELIAAEPDVQQPIAFAWDDRGRLWVAEAYSYPQKRPEGRGLDKILIFEDRDGDGKFETKKVFAEGLNLVSGLEIGYGGVWVGAAPQLLFIPDRNHDDIPDGPPEVLLDGFGFQDTHECLNSFVWGPDGWLYGNQGVFNLAHIGKPGSADAERRELRAGVWRYHPLRHEFEVFAEGGSNPWGLDYDEYGEFFMSHCRSYWGRGCVTHVIQGGQFWNQANANYAPYIIPNPPEEFPEFRNFLLASAHHDHGAGGAGQRGTDAIFGGHSHVGTMIYLGDNWPDEYRGRLFTHNLGGHQINVEVNKPLGSGYETIHAEQDLLFCSDPRYVAVDLQYGPDGAVYIIDWYDQQHCHNPNVERWDRSNGRIYRLEWTETYKPVRTDLGAMPDAELAGLLGHKNAWYARTAQRLLAERAALRPDKGAKSPAVPILEDIVKSKSGPELRLKALWTLHGMGRAPGRMLSEMARDFDEHLRGWAVRLAADHPGAEAASILQRLADDSSPIVRRQVASAMQRVDAKLALDISSTLIRRVGDKDDRNLPLLLWDGLAPRIGGDPALAAAVAKKSKLPWVTEYIYWYAASVNPKAFDFVIESLAGLEGDALRRRLAGMELAAEAHGTVQMPTKWKPVAARLHTASDPRIRRQVERLAAAFGDGSLFPELRTVLADASKPGDDRRHAFGVLSRSPDRGSVSVFIKLLDDAVFRAEAIRVLGRLDSPEIAPALIAHFGAFNFDEKSDALGALTSRVPFALTLLDAVAGRIVPRETLTAFHVRALTELKNAEIDRRVAENWGRIQQSPAEKRAQMDKLEKIFNEAPLWAYSGEAGRAHFQRLCSQCHRVGDLGNRLGPELTGAGKQGIRYFLENIIDPNAVIGADFQMTTIETKKGDVASGLLGSENADAVTLRTPTGPIVLPKAEIVSRVTSDKSLMPEGLLETLTDREQIELLKFLTSN